MCCSKLRIEMIIEKCSHAYYKMRRLLKNPTTVIIKCKINKMSRYQKIAVENGVRFKESSAHG